MGDHEKQQQRPFRQGLFMMNEDGTGRLLANRCQHCQITYFPRREFCVECGESEFLEDVKLSTQGSLYTFSVVHRAPPSFKTPYVIGYVDLEEDGVRVFAPLTDCQPEELKVGTRMELVFGKIAKNPGDHDQRGLLTYKFRPRTQTA